MINSVEMWCVECGIGRNSDCEETWTILTLQPRLCNSTYEILFSRDCNIKMCRLFCV